MHPYPTLRAAFYEVVLLGRSVYVIGGWDGFQQVSTNEVYDIGKDTWSAALAMPTPRAEMAVVGDRKRMYTVGGGAFGAASEANEVFDP